ncbi:hypothetical protein [Motiliproteus sp. SC1-56]|uniref:hypothetical protein n=1 Tax=Motiliproteus sp. SC1-56 TaxID=2799565 RepID=UPI001A903817|nr:hypothetical protein [Motiliproteus sp. SC1-56]
MTYPSYTGLPNDDRRIAEELSAMGAFDNPAPEASGRLAALLESVGMFLTWLRWKGEVGVYGCRVGAEWARRQEAMAIA